MGAHLRASETSAEEAAAASAAAAALLSVASSLWMAEASTEVPLLPPGGRKGEKRKITDRKTEIKRKSSKEGVKRVTLHALRVDSSSSRLCHPYPQKPGR